MPLTASHADAQRHKPGTPAGNNHAPDFVGSEILTRMPFFGAASATGRLAADAEIAASTTSLRTSDAKENDLALRMRMLIRHEGSMASIARRCGFSEGAVRSWRDGQSDISRERCVVMARTLNVSLIWLITGEGPMRQDPVVDGFSLRSATEPTASTLHAADHRESPTIRSPQPAVDSRLLAAALRLLQSYVGLLGGSLNPMQRADVLAELYDILGTVDQPGHIDRLIAFHSTLGGRMRRSGSPLA
jgi:hypothetical protein